MKPTCFVKLLSDTAKFGYPVHEGDIGYDLYADEDVEIRRDAWTRFPKKGTLEELHGEMKTRKFVGTGVSLQFTMGGYARIAPRSGLAALGLDVAAGVVDSSYTGELKIGLINNSVFDSVEIKKGNKIAQLIFESASKPELQFVDKLEETTRSTSGFGSTDAKSLLTFSVPSAKIFSVPKSYVPTSESTQTHPTSEGDKKFFDAGYDICTQNV